MENQITCPNCGKTITNNPVIDSAAKKENLGDTFIICDCGERITFWAITAQLRNQMNPVERLRAWFQSFSKK